jgi:hypothetical protein
MKPSATSEAACIVADNSAPARDTLYIVGIEPGTSPAISSDCERYASARSPVVVAETPGPGVDLRDILDRGLTAAGARRPDVTVTRDPAVIAYASAGSDYFAVTLPWDRTYALVSDDSSPAAPSQTERNALARDAVAADVRGAMEPFAWLDDPACLAHVTPASVSSKSVVAYPENDAIARQLAERLVALAAAPARLAWLPAALTASGSTRAFAMAADSIPAALAGGRAAAAVVALTRDPRSACATSNRPPASHVAPLVDSRAHALVRRGSGAAFIVGANGTLRFIRRTP